MPPGSVPFSVEVFPARTSAAALALGHTVQRLSQRGAAFVAVTCGAAGTGASASADLVGYVQTHVAAPVLAHVTTWGADPDELRDRVRTLRDQGVRRVLAVRGDPPRVEPGLAGPVTASDLVAIARETFAEAGIDDPDIAVAAFPLGHPAGARSHATAIDHDLALLAAKQRAGATRALTQVQFEPEGYAAYVERARAAGVTIPIVPGVLAVTSADRLRRVVELTGGPVPTELAEALDAAGSPEDAEAVGVAFASRLSRALLEVGAPAIHFYTLNAAEPVLRILDSLESSDPTTPTTHRDAAVARTERTFA
ncbi:methylenetetrahydrofolate reductase [Frondihabitans sucicola]|uniref:Methylenetetrahydrofolate reductase n=1 Tax=Frondihabitans sucicola TaxID=1268041 RepID=A0ABM8GNZ8_9MICO|nr:methylenetetrahydrofolate reductase [Frondihabitans sucicola]